MKILVADSDFLSANGLRRMLEAAGHTVDLARTGEEISEALPRRPEVLILDLALRGRAPLDLLAAIRSAERCEHLYVVVMSARTSPSELEKAFAAGADDFVRKPIVREEIVARIDGARRLRAAVTKLASPAEPFASLDVWSDFPRIVKEAVSAAMNVDLSVRRTRYHHELGERARASAPAALVSIVPPIGPSELRVAIIGHDVGLTAAGGSTRHPVYRSRAMRVVLDAAAATAAAIEQHALAEDVVLARRRVRTIAAGELPGTFACAPLLRRFALEGEGPERAVHLVILAAVAASQSTCVLASSLRAGMMVAREVRNASGAVLLPAGARVTEASATRIASAVGPGAFVEVRVDPSTGDAVSQLQGYDDDRGSHDEDEREAA